MGEKCFRAGFQDVITHSHQLAALQSKPNHHLPPVISATLPKPTEHPSMATSDSGKGYASGYCDKHGGEIIQCARGKGSILSIILLKSNTGV